jgi:4-hydroxybenzoate polyprenyltransferase
MAEESIAEGRSRTGPLAIPYQLKLILKSMRPRQWTKNGIVFMALIFSVNQEWTPEKVSTWDHLLLKAILAAIAFSLVSGAGYLLNDTRDRESDRLHPRKSRRPIASGALSPQVAVTAAVVCIAVGTVLSFGLDWRTGLTIVAYIAVQVVYTLWLKNEVILDVMTIAALFVLRAMGGAFAVDVPISPWLYVVTGLGALFLAVTKRRAEVNLLQGDASSHRPTLALYTKDLVDQMTSMVTASTVIAYALYTFTAENLPDNHAMMLTVPFVVYGIFRYLFLSLNRDEGGSPEEVLLKDIPMILTIVGWVATSMIILTAYR